MMRIAFVFGDVPPYRWPMLEQLAAVDGIEVTVLRMSRRDWFRSWEHDAPAHIRSKLLPSLAVRFQSPLSGPEVLHFSPQLPLEISRDKYDLVISWCWVQPYTLTALLTAKAKHIPVMMWDDSIPHPPSRLKRLAMPIIRRVMRAYTACLAGSSRSQEYFASLGADRSRLFLFPIVVGDHFRLQGLPESRSLACAAIGLPPGGLRVLYIGQLIPRKGVFELLDAWRLVQRELPSGAATLVMIGDGPAKPELQTRVRQYGLESSVLITPYKQQAELARWYAAGDILVLASHYDTWGCVVNEAMSAGLPVIATETVGSVGDLVKHEVTGLVIPPRHTPALAEAMARLLLDEGLRRRLGREASETVAGWDAKFAVACLLKAIRDVIC